MKKSSLCYMTAALALLTACGETTVKETLGLDRRAPDEFRVVSRPPLSMPPQFDLRPPSVEGDAGSDSRSKAGSLLLGNTGANTKATPMKKTASNTAAENIFLEKAGASTANPNVKQELAEKRISEQMKKEEAGFWDNITTLPGNKEPVVKAEDEAKRIEKNKAEGKAVTEGETPQTGGGPVSVLQRWFGND